MNENGQYSSEITNDNNNYIDHNDQTRYTLDKNQQSLNPLLPQLDIESIHVPIHEKHNARPFSTTFYDSYTSSPTSSCSSVSIEPVSAPLHRPQQVPRLKTKPTMEHLTKVIPNFLLKNTPSKPEQWKMTKRR
jgi:hypothetical protein